jgi:hypothetical protein
VAHQSQLGLEAVPGVEQLFGLVALHVDLTKLVFYGDSLDFLPGNAGAVKYPLNVALDSARAATNFLP